MPAIISALIEAIFEIASQTCLICESLLMIKCTNSCLFKANLHFETAYKRLNHIILLLLVPTRLLIRLMHHAGNQIMKTKAVFFIKW